MLAQAPPLLVSAPASAPGGGGEVTLTNQFTSPVTAFVLEVRAGATMAHPGLLLARHIEDSNPGPARDGARLGPQQSRTIRFGGPVSGDVNYDVGAVIYADGSSAGDPALVGHFLHVRQAEAADISAVLPLLDQAEADPRLAQDLPTLIQTFAARAAAHAIAMRDGTMHHNTDRICGSVAASLSVEPSRETPQVAVKGLSVMFTRWLAQLQASKPNTGAAPAAP